MKKYLPPIILSVVLAVGSIFVSATSSPAKPNPLDSVKAIAQQHEGDLFNVCSAGSTSEGRHFWLTAAHCIGTEPQFIMGDRVDVVAIDPKADLAIIHTPKEHAPALPLATSQPTPCFNITCTTDRIFVIGYPLGVRNPLIFWGRIAGGVKEDHDYTILQLPGAPGESGSPVMNQNGEVVSVVQVLVGEYRDDEGRKFGPVLGGPTLEMLRKYKEYFGG